MKKRNIGTVTFKINEECCDLLGDSRIEALPIFAQTVQRDLYEGCAPCVLHRAGTSLAQVPPTTGAQELPALQVG